MIVFSGRWSSRAPVSQGLGFRGLGFRVLLKELNFKLP